ncbi:PIN domain-containing protein [Mucilaginibacter sp. SMC90]|uniref:PIN domain-containing protein n=1 Tax=Mucilaginibacter sp. SMC90 TaxID=2929803 RepID=UPI001FB287E2|nr:PIN domain-containing protein [Mucilaginibacter sp. SMC90]UOE47855.1 PIN domain-containing protein [Mucilaginibacter sp. SMC90]
MKKTYKEYYPLSKNDNGHFFDNAFIVLDTNVLINFYRYSNSTVTKFLEVLKQLNGRLYMPYQVGKEFHNNRVDEIISQKGIYKDSVKELQNIKNKFEDKNRNPFLSIGNLELFDKIITELEQSASKYETYLTDDEILVELNIIFKDAVGNEPSKDVLEKIIKEGKERYKNKIPPGFADEKSKPEEIRKYGDLIIWKDLIEKAKKDEKPCLFVTDDRKEDWWFINKSKQIISPLPELQKEFLHESKQLFYAYQPFSFLEHIKNIVDIEIQPEVIAEVKDLPSLSDDGINQESIVIKELAEGQITRLEGELRIIGYEIEIFPIKGIYYNLIVNLPPIFDMKRKFLKDLAELTKTYRFDIVSTGEMGIYVN